MNALDYGLLLCIVLGIFHGLIVGLRSNLWLLVVLLGSILVNVTLLKQLELIILNLSGIGADKYPDAPAVMVFILEDADSLASFVSILPGIITVFFLILYCVMSSLFLRFRKEATPKIPIRLFSVFLGFINGVALDLIAIMQLLRLSWHFTGQIVEGSLLVSVLIHKLPWFLPGLAGVL